MDGDASLFHVVWIIEAETEDAVEDDAIERVFVEVSIDRRARVDDVIS